MIIGGLQKFSMLDYPGRLSAIVFTAGCNFRCHFCYNPILVLPRKRGDKSKYLTPPSGLPDGGDKNYHPVISEDDFFAFLADRQGKLDAVVVTGGEPTMHKDLPDFLSKIKKAGYLVKLDTNGTEPEMIARLIKQGLVDYLAMDIKNSPVKYAQTTGVSTDLEKIKKSLKMIMKSGLPYEFRTTIVSGLHETGDIIAIARLIRGAAVWYLQRFKSDIDLVDSTYHGKPASTAKELKAMAAAARKYVKKCEIR